MGIPGDRDWSSSVKDTPLSSWTDRFQSVHEFQAAPDGDHVAAVVKTGESEFAACVDGDLWPERFDKMWHLRYAPDGRLSALVSTGGEWTVAVDGIPWENRFGYAWNTQFSRDGDHIAVAFQQDMAYGMACDDLPWETTYPNLTPPALS
ncbi:WD40 repeat domain-containing protein, partial [bacterium]|nr:WD40 repeat domain-containing protein [bacterium]